MSMTITEKILANAAGKKLWLTDLTAELQYNKENLLNPWFVVRGGENRVE